MTLAKPQSEDKKKSYGEVEITAGFYPKVSPLAGSSPARISAPEGPTDDNAFAFEKAQQEKEKEKLRETAVPPRRDTGLDVEHPSVTADEIPDEILQSPEFKIGRAHV